MSEIISSQTSNFIQDIISQDLKSNKHNGVVKTRFPPEPNGYLHIGHAKSICLNFGLAAQNGGTCNLRFDDTNPEKENPEYVAAIQQDVRWLGFDWEDRLFFSSDYFEQLYQYAVELIKKGKAYVCSLPPDRIREYRGTLTEPGKDSPFRDRPIEENIDLFTRMRAGEFEDGAHVLRAKIDMQSPNLNLRDPVLYRIKKVVHHRTGDKWCIYPMYDFTHCLSDSIEQITHSVCTLEFKNNRPLYDWTLDTLGVDCHPQQIEFARLNLTYTVMSKRKLIELVEKGFVKGWDDPRMPTISGLRRRGYTPRAIRKFCERIGVAKRDSMVDFALLEYSIREDLNETTPRVMAVLQPLKLVIDNYPTDQVEEFEFPNHPEKPEMGSRRVPFSNTLYIEATDFLEEPPKKFFRLAPGKEVRLRYAYYVTCQEIHKDANGRITEIHCTYDPESRGGSSPDKRKVKGTLHWVSAPHAVPAEVRLYDHLFTKPNPMEETEESSDFTSFINPNSLEILSSCFLEPYMANAVLPNQYQFERMGYFCVDPDSTPDKLVFNRTVTLRDTWAKINKPKS